MIEILIRFIELLMSSIVISTLTTISIDTKITPNTTQGVAIAFFIGIVIYTTIQVFQLRKSFFNLNTRREYIVYNYAAYFIFAIVQAFVRVFLGREVHMWTFCIYKFMMYANVDMTWWQSAIYGHIVMLAIIFLAPIGSPSARAYRLAAELGEDEFGNPLPDTDFEDDMQDSAADDDAQDAFADPFRNLPDEITMLNSDEEYVEDDDLDEW